MSHTMEELAKSPTIMLVDDDADLIAGLSDRLMFEGFRVITAHSGLEAISCLQISRPAVMLLDFHMPEMDGAETFRVVRLSHPSLPIILMTGADPDENSVQALICEVTDYLPKPIDWEVLKHKLAGALRHHAGGLDTF